MYRVKLLFSSLLFLSLLAAGIYVAYNRGLLKLDLAQFKNFPLKNLDPKLNPAQFADAKQRVDQEVKYLFSNGGQVLGEVKQAIDENITPNNNDKNLSEKAFEYARYRYCQEVIKEYENNPNP